MVSLEPDTSVLFDFNQIPARKGQEVEIPK